MRFMKVALEHPISSIGKNNLFGFGSYDASPFIASYRFSSVDENINYIAQQIKATYLSSGNWRSYRDPSWFQNNGYE